ncbi:MAG: peptidoglycan DD-metalloendopeptidase family protein [Desulfobacca sp.]|uniref:peptidoglycan DD-metalloendopeptidase family protein n=1 Tax=Desulfobacca sp. TaxID=2067990 RepID=UPI004049BDEA
MNRSRLADFGYWLFHPGMFFRARQQWWGRRKPRPTPHEGLDICWYRTRDGGQCLLPPAALIPAPFSGRVVKIGDDFLGQSIFLIHSGLGAGGREVLTALGHTRPLAGVVTGTVVSAGEEIATLAEPASRRTSVPPHLHLTIALLLASYPEADLCWEKLADNPRLLLCDPLFVFPTSFAQVTT